MTNKSNKNLVIAIIVSSLLLSGSIVFLGLQLSGNTQNNDPYKKYRKSVEADVKHDDAVLGDINAPVTLVEYSDYQCPYCRKYFQETYEKIKTNYVEKGLVKIIFKDFPLTGHPDGFVASNAAECVREQTNDPTYFAYHDAVFKSQGSFDLGTVPIPKETLIAAATDLGVEAKQFEKCFDSNKYENEIIADIFAGEENKVEATPTFIINGVTIAGAYPYEKFEEVIEGILADLKTQNPN